MSGIKAEERAFFWGVGAVAIGRPMGGHELLPLLFFFLFPSHIKLSLSQPMSFFILFFLFSHPTGLRDEE